MKDNSNSTSAQKFSVMDALKKLLSEINGSPSQSAGSSINVEKADALSKAANDVAAKAKADTDVRQRELEAKRRAREEADKAERERVAEATSMELPLDFENAFFGDERVEGVHCDSAADALILSLNNLGRVDIEYISEITGLEMKTVISELRGSIFQNPETWDKCFYKGWEVKEEYLSGNLFKKWRIAKRENRIYRGYFQSNVKALEACMPEPPRQDDIYVTLGSPWVPCVIIDEFVCHILNLKRGQYNHTKHDDLTGTWELPGKTDMEWRSSVRARSGRYRIFRSIRPISAANTSRWFVSTASPEKAA